MRCLVVGAGLLGLSTAWFLNRGGAEVVVCERAPGPGTGTSFANGGMLHASQASPWNEPGVLWQALRMLGRDDAALLIRPRALPPMLRWAWSFFRQSAPVRFRDNLARNARLAAYSLEMLDQAFAPLELNFMRADRGTLKVYRGEAELDAAVAGAESCREWDIRFEVLDSGAVCALEPALAPVGMHLTGGIHFPDDVSGDAHRFCRELAARCGDAGVELRYETTVEKLVTRGTRLGGAQLSGQFEMFDACVVAAASHTPALLGPLGVRVPVQPVKGYSLTLPMTGWSQVPRVPVIDEHFHAALCPLGDRLRIAGTAEFAGFDETLTPERIENLFTLLGQAYPDGAREVDRESVVRWAGLRPMSPDGVGIMGATTIDGLFLNTGHGHLGWTMAPGAGRLVSDLVLGREPEIDSRPYALARF